MFSSAWLSDRHERRRLSAIPRTPLLVSDLIAQIAQLFPLPAEKEAAKFLELLYRITRKSVHERAAGLRTRPARFVFEQPGHLAQYLRQRLAAYHRSTDLFGLTIQTCLRLLVLLFDLCAQSFRLFE